MNYRNVVRKIYLMAVISVFTACGGPLQITSPADGTTIAFNGQQQSQQFNVTDSSNNFSGVTATIYSVNPGITGTCAVASSYCTCVLNKTQNSGGSCSATQPCDAILTIAQGNVSSRVVLKVTF